jgi:Tfp pilus assembly protein PilF
MYLQDRPSKKRRKPLNEGERKLISLQRVSSVARKDKMQRKGIVLFGLSVLFSLSLLHETVEAGTEIKGRWIDQPGSLMTTENKKGTTALKSVTEKAQPGGIQKISGDRFYQKGLKYHRRGMLDEAIRMYLEVLRLSPKHFDANLNLAAAYIEKSEFSKARPILQDLKDKEHENSDVLLNLAITEIGLGNCQDAMCYLDMAENQTQGDQFTVLFHRGVAWSRLGKMEDALLCYKMAEALLPRTPDLVFNMALAYDKMQDYDNALRYYALVLERDALPTSVEKRRLKNRMMTLKGFLSRRTGQIEGIENR